MTPEFTFYGVVQGAGDLVGKSTSKNKMYDSIDSVVGSIDAWLDNQGAIPEALLDVYKVVIYTTQRSQDTHCLTRLQ